MHSEQSSFSVAFTMMERDPERFLRISLHPLSYDFIAKLSSKVFEVHGLSEFAFSAQTFSAIVKEIEVNSGGKPLYVIELTKAVADRLKTEYPQLLTLSKITPDQSEKVQTASDTEGSSGRSDLAHFAPPAVADLSSLSATDDSVMNEKGLLPAVRDVMQTFSSHRVEEV